MKAHVVKIRFNNINALAGELTLSFNSSDKDSGQFYERAIFSEEVIVLTTAQYQELLVNKAIMTE